MTTNKLHQELKEQDWYNDWKKKVENEFFNDIPVFESKIHNKNW